MMTLQHRQYTPIAHVAVASPLLTYLYGWGHGPTECSGAHQPRLPSHSSYSVIVFLRFSVVTDAPTTPTRPPLTKFWLQGCSEIQQMISVIRNWPSDRVDSDGSRVDKIIREQRLVVRSIKAWHFNPVSARVRPVQILAYPVNCHALRRPKSCTEQTYRYALLIVSFPDLSYCLKICYSTETLTDISSSFQQMWHRSSLISSLHLCTVFKPIMSTICIFTMLFSQLAYYIALKLPPYCFLELKCAFIILNTFSMSHLNTNISNIRKRDNYNLAYWTMQRDKMNLSQVY